MPWLSKWQQHSPVLSEFIYCARGHMYITICSSYLYKMLKTVYFLHNSIIVITNTCGNFLTVFTIQNERLRAIEQINHYSQLQRDSFQAFKTKEEADVTSPMIGDNGRTAPNWISKHCPLQELIRIIYLFIYVTEE